MADAPLTPAELAAYLARIGHDAPVAPELATLRALHRAHITAIPFENLATQLGAPPSLDADATFARLVTGKLGGWCYQQNGLFARALAAIGFEVTRLAGAVMREVRGDDTMGSHLALKVRIDGADWLADVGFGSAMLAPLPLAEGRDDSGPIPISLARTPEGYWRLTTETATAPMSFDFHDRPADEADFARMCAWQGNDPQSVFVQNLAVRRLTPETHYSLKGRVLETTTLDGVAKQVIEGPEELVSTLHDRFGLDEPRAASLWPAVVARHAELFGAQAA